MWPEQTISHYYSSIIISFSFFFVNIFSHLLTVDDGCMSGHAELLGHLRDLLFGNEGPQLLSVHLFLLWSLGILPLMKKRDNINYRQDFHPLAKWFNVNSATGKRGADLHLLN